MTLAIFAALAVLLASPAYGQTSWCGVGCADVTVAHWVYQIDPERARERRENANKRTRVIICKPAEDRRMLCTEQ